MQTNQCLTRLVSGVVAGLVVVAANVATFADLKCCNGHQTLDPAPNTRCGSGSACPAYNQQTNPACSGLMVERQAEIAKCVAGTSSQRCVDDKSDPPLYCTKTWNCTRSTCGPGAGVTCCDKGTAKLDSEGNQIGSFEYPGKLESCMECES